MLQLTTLRDALYILFLDVNSILRFVLSYVQWPLHEKCKAVIMNETDGIVIT
jgi:hypothetical protein